MAVLVVAFLSIIVYLKVQQSKCALPRSDRASSGSISKSTQSTLQQPSFDLKQSISEIKSCVFNEVRIAMNFTLLFFHRWSKIWQYIKTSYTKLKNSSVAFIWMVTRYDFTLGFQSWNHLVQRHNHLKWFRRKQLAFITTKRCTCATSFPGPLLFPSSLAPGEGKRRGPGNEVGTCGDNFWDYPEMSWNVARTGDL